MPENLGQGGAQLVIHRGHQPVPQLGLLDLGHPLDRHVLNHDDRTAALPFAVDGRCGAATQVNRPSIRPAHRHDVILHGLACQRARERGLVMVQAPLPEGVVQRERGDVLDGGHARIPGLSQQSRERGRGEGETTV